MNTAPLRSCFRQQRAHSQRGGLRCSQLRPETGLDLRWLALLDAENVQTVILDRREDHNPLKVLCRSSGPSPAGDPASNDIHRLTSETR